MLDHSAKLPHITGSPARPTCRRRNGRIQFIISCAIFFVCIVLLPRLGIGGQVMRIYPCLAAGYFILFLMYAAIIFLYYFNDLKGAVLTAASFCGITFLGSLFSSQLSAPWYGLGLVAGAFTGFCAAYHRLRVMEPTSMDRSTNEQ